MILKVPKIKQRYKNGCGAVALSMLFKYFDKDLSEKDIIQKIGGLHSYGSLLTDLALLAEQQGFSVTCHSYDLYYFAPQCASLSRTDFMKVAKQMIENEKNQYRNKTTKSVLNVLKSDIDFEMVMPSLKTIQKFLDQKSPVIVGVNATVLYEEKEKSLRAGHFIVLTGYDKTNFYYNDPYDGKEFSISHDKLIFAISNNVLDSSGYVLVIQKKK